MKFSVFLVSVIFGIALPFGSASADFKKDRKICRINIFNPRPNAMIPACTNLILSGRISGPGLARIYSNRGLAYEIIDQYDRAIQDYDRAIQLRPDYAFHFYHRGLSYEALGEQDQARKDYKKSYDLGNRTDGLIEKLRIHGMMP